MVSLAQEDLFPRFQNVMEKYGYDWDYQYVMTADDYRLTTFHITGKKGENIKADKGSVLVQHGNGLDGTRMLDKYEEGKPFSLILVDEGYDVWMGNNRGTEYSQYSPSRDVSDPSFWEFGWSEMGLYDDVANIKMIKE